MTGDIFFINPTVLLLLLGLPLLYIFLSKTEQTRANRSKLFGFPGNISKYKPLLVTITCAILILACARPYSGYEDVKVPGSSRDISLIVDVSKSMLATDVSPSRLQFVKHKVQDVIDFISKSTPGDRISLILFAGDAYEYCPLTSDYAVLKVFADSISTDLITAPGSALNDAIQTALTSFKDLQATRPYLLLLSDGEDDELNIQKVVTSLKADGRTLDVLGIGTPEGGPIEEGRGAYLKDRDGNIVITKLNEPSLQQLATRTGGKYFRANLLDNDIRTLLAPSLTLKTFNKGGGTQSFRVYHEFGPMLLWIPIIGIGLAIFSKRPQLLFSLTFLLFLPKLVSSEEKKAEIKAEAPSTLHDTFIAYESGDFATAQAGFQKAYDGGDTSPKVVQGLASSLYKNGKSAEASKIFEQLATDSKNGREKFEALYNLGTSNIVEKKYDDAIKNLTNALQIKNEDTPAKFNLDLAKKLKEIQQKQDEEKKKDKKQDKNKEQNKAGESPSPSPTASPSPSEENKSEESSPSPSPSPDSKDGKSGASPSPTSTPGPQPSISDEKGVGQNAEQNPTPIDKEAMKKDEAHAWLDSLADSPVLLRRKVGKARKDQKQLW